MEVGGKDCRRKREKGPLNKVNMTKEQNYLKSNVLKNKDEECMKIRKSKMKIRKTKRSSVLLCVILPLLSKLRSSNAKIESQRKSKVKSQKSNLIQIIVLVKILERGVYS